MEDKCDGRFLHFLPSSCERWRVSAEGSTSAALRLGDYEFYGYGRPRCGPQPGGTAITQVSACMVTASSFSRSGVASAVGGGVPAVPEQEIEGGEQADDSAMAMAVPESAAAPEQQGGEPVAEKPAGALGKAGGEVEQEEEQEEQEQEDGTVDDVEDRDGGVEGPPGKAAEDGSGEAAQAKEKLGDPAAVNLTAAMVYYRAAAAAGSAQVGPQPCLITLSHDVVQSAAEPLQFVRSWLSL